MQVNRWMKLLVVGTLLVLGSGCATRNMLSDGAGGKAMLAGNDPVSYHIGASPVKGDPKITADWDGGTYRFASAANRDLFTKAPEKYAPQYGGYCGNGAPYSILLGGGASAYKIVDGRLFMFSGPDSLKYWEMDEKKNLELGDGYWKTEMSNISSAFFHSYWRIFFKVPHYKTGKELAAEWQTRQAKKS
jgi:YHS domain-containing protein